MVVATLGLSSGYHELGVLRVFNNKGLVRQIGPHLDLGTGGAYVNTVLNMMRGEDGK